jgi:hypothetical protein
VAFGDTQGVPSAAIVATKPSAADGNARIVSHAVMDIDRQDRTGASATISNTSRDSSQVATRISRQRREFYREFRIFLAGIAHRASRNGPGLPNTSVTIPWYGGPGK